MYSFSLSSASLAQKDTSGAEGISRNRRAVPILHGAGEACASCSSFSERSLERDSDFKISAQFSLLGVWIGFGWEKEGEQSPQVVLVGAREGIESSKVQ